MDELQATSVRDERVRMLVVEPNRSYCGVLARRLAEAGFRVTTADSGASALAELHRVPIDLVLAELNMPRIGGAELARAIRGEAQWRDLPIMLITGRSDPCPVSLSMIEAKVTTWGTLHPIWRARSRKAASKLFRNCSTICVSRLSAVVAGSYS